MNVEPLDPLSNELLDAARHGHAPRPGRRERVRRRIVASIGAAAFAHSSLAVAATTWVKLWGAVGILAIGVGGAYATLHRPPGEPAPPLHSEPESVQSQATSAPPEVAPEPPTVATTASVVVPDPPPPEVEVKKARAASPRPAQGAPSIGAETALLLAAQSALHAGDSTKALSLLDEHAKRFPSGALVEERQASRVQALCMAGRTAEARDVARAFLASHPGSPAAIQVRASCGGG